MSEDELNETLRLHKLWLAGEDGGAQADLEEANLAGADLRGADLAGADLRGRALRGGPPRRTRRGRISRGEPRRCVTSAGPTQRDRPPGANLEGAYLNGRTSAEPTRGADLSMAILAGPT